MPPSIDSIIDGEWSWYGQTPRAPDPASNRYVNVSPGFTFAPGPEKPGM